jgi:hypothetical protein
MPLRVAMGFGETREQSIYNAVTEYNRVEGYKVFHKSDTGFEFDTPAENPEAMTGTFQTEIWFTTTAIDPPKPDFTYIGSVGIDPNDPEWKEKIHDKYTTITHAPIHVE